MKQLFSLFILFSLSLQSQTIYTFAGDGTFGFTGDGGSALVAQLYHPAGVAVDAAGNTYIVDTDNSRIRKVSPAGIISTFAGTGNTGFSGDGGLAIAADLFWPTGVTVDPLGNVYIADINNHRIRKVNTSGIITTFAGTGTAGFSGDGGSATSAALKFPSAIAFDIFGNAFIADQGNHRIRKVNVVGVISTFAGNGISGSGGNGGAAISAQLNSPAGVATDPSGNVYIADFSNNQVRMVNGAGIISVFAGTGVLGFSGDGGFAPNAELSNPSSVAVDASGNVYISDQYNYRIRKVSSAIITTFAGTGVLGSSGDGGAPGLAKISDVRGIAVDANDNVLLADFGNHKIREICITSCFVNLNEMDEVKNEIIIYPNPSPEKIFIRSTPSTCENSEIMIFNDLGEMIMKMIYKNPIDVSKLPQGVYFLEIRNTDGSETHSKFLKE